MDLELPYGNLGSYGTVDRIAGTGNHNRFLREVPKQPQSFPSRRYRSCVERVCVPRRWAIAGGHCLPSFVFLCCRKFRLCLVHHRKGFPRACGVPIYLGDAERLKLIAPPNSVIYASDFEDAASLAVYLKALIEDRQEYEKYLAWRADKHAFEKLEIIMTASRWTDKNMACTFCDFLHTRAHNKMSDPSSSTSRGDVCVA